MASSLLPPPSIMASSSSSSRGAPPINFPRSSLSTVKQRAIAIETSNYNNSAQKMISGAAPWLMLPPVPVGGGGERVYSFYSLTEKKVVDLELLKGFGYCDSSKEVEVDVMGSSHGFLVFNDKQRGLIFLYNPISGRRIDLPFLPARMYNSSLKDLGIKKVVISEDESRAMMIFGYANRLAFCSPGHSNEWTPLVGPTRLEYTDVVYSKRRKMFMCCTTDSDVGEWDLVGHHQQNWEKCKELQQQHLWWIDIKDLIYDDESCSFEEPYVVFAEHSDQLYLVCRYIMERTTYLQNVHRYGFPLRDWDDCFPYKTIGFDVYKVTRVLDNNTLQFKYMEEEGSLDNLVMFIGANHSFALPADDYPELKPDSIYFTDHPDHIPLFCQPGIYDTAVYSFNDRTFHPLEYPPPPPPPNQNETKNQQLVDVPEPPLWFTPSA